MQEFNEFKVEFEVVPQNTEQAFSKPIIPKDEVRTHTKLFKQRNIFNRFWSRKVLIAQSVNTFLLMITKKGNENTIKLNLS